MAPEERFVPRFAAEPPQEALPYGRWGERLTREFLAACLELDGEGSDLGEPGEIVWYPDRSWNGHTYVPASVPTSTGFELFGYVRFTAAAEGADPSDFYARADFTEETAARNPDWKLDLCEETIGSWRGHVGAATMTLVWGRPMIAGGRIATAELADLAVDQCELLEERFTLIAPDDYRGDLLDIKLFGGKGQELARESLYADEDQDENDEEAPETAQATHETGSETPGVAENGREAEAQR